MAAQSLSLRRVLVALAILAVSVYAGAMIWLVTNETRLVFQPGAKMGERRPAQPWEQVQELPAWSIPAKNAGATTWVIYLHGNASDLSGRLNILHYERLRELGVHVLAPEYRGFGGVAGVPSENGLAEDARRAYDYLLHTRHVDPRRIVIYGWSLGSAVAVTLASRVDEAAVILEGAPASIVAIGQHRYPYFPVRLIIRNPFESIQRIDKIGSPVLFLHSPEDVVVPFAEGKRLFDAAPQPKQFVEVSGGHVYASEKDPRFFPAVGAFLHGLQLIP